ncbi:MAG: hypothetical protein QNJ26_11910 [Desulfobacterales bacterium]|nr:hypothetical protein [Desulfobacterales bacterium]
MRFRHRNSVLMVIVVIVAAIGCASRVAYRFESDSQRPPETVRFFAELDAAVYKTGVGHGADFRIEGFPYLRANRFLVSLKQRLENDAQRRQWVFLLQQLNLAARKAEIQNLPAAQVQRLVTDFGLGPGRENLMAKVVVASDQLLTHDQRQPDFFEVLNVAVQDSSEYSTLMRVFGLYPLAAIPVAIVTLRVNNEIAEWHQLPEDERPILGTLTTYGPADWMAFSGPEIRKMMERSRKNPLGIPLPSVDDQNKLLAMFAPLIIQDEAADYDKLGAVVWTVRQVSVDADRPLMYFYFSHAYLNNTPILQINYVIWYSERSGPNSPRIERGNLDGLTIRVSLDENGSPFMVDVMNNCGCYHFYVPRHERVERILPSPMAIDAFVPAWLPDDYPRQRLAIRVMSGWHQVEHIGSRSMPSDYRPYQFEPYDRLEMLPKADARHESIFNSRGIAKYTERVESDIFIPMGVPQVGRMRQRGHHAIKFVGRAHFDDPYLFDEHFEFNLN